MKSELIEQYTKLKAEFKSGMGHPSPEGLEISRLFCRVKVQLDAQSRLVELLIDNRGTWHTEYDMTGHAFQEDQELERVLWYIVLEADPKVFSIDYDTNDLESELQRYRSQREAYLTAHGDHLLESLLTGMRTALERQKN